MSLTDYHWEQEDSSSEYTGRYVTHSAVNKHSVIEELENPEVDLELGEHTLEYGEERLDVRLDVNNDWAAFFYDETFEEELGDENLDKVLTYFLTPDRWKTHAEIHPVEK